MQETVQRFAEVAECFGLLINQSKTVVMRAVPNASVTPQHIYIGGNALQDVSSFSYLGSVITPNNDMQEEIDSRVAKARRAYHMLSQRLWRQRGIRRRTKVKVFNAVVTPMCPVWSRHMDEEGVSNEEAGECAMSSC